MKKILTIILTVCLLTPNFVGASPVTWDKIPGILQPLRSSWTDAVRVPYITATSTTATSTFAANVQVTSGCFSVTTNCLVPPPDGSRTVLMGDSITLANGTNALGWSLGQSSQTVGYRLGGYFSMLNNLTGAPFRVIRNSGVSGDDTFDMLARFETDVLDYNPTTVSIMAGTNDILFYGATTTIANLTNMYNQVQNAGAFLIVWTMPPRDSMAASGRLNRSIVNQFIRDFARENAGVLLMDTEKLVSNYTALTGAAAFGGWKAGLAGDGVHPSTVTGVYQMAAQGTSTINKLFKPLELIKSSSDTYDGAGSPAAGTFEEGQNLLTATQSFNLDRGGSALNSGGSGIYSGTPPTGMVAFCFSCTGLGITFSTTTDQYSMTDVLNIGLNATSSSLQRFKLLVAIEPLMTIGKYYEFSGVAEIVSGAERISNLQAAIEANGGTQNKVQDIDSKGSVDVDGTPFPAPMKLTFRTPRYLYNGEASVQAFIDFRIESTGTAQVNISQWAIREYSTYQD